MSSSVSSASLGSAELSSRVRLLEERLNEVERRLGIGVPAAAAEPREAPEPEVSVPALLDNPAGTLVLAGQTLFGLALAYLLRAFTENQTLPVPAGVGLGLLYAMAWLVWAARTPTGEVFTLGLRAATSVLVLLPLLWEATIRFRALSAWATGAVLVLFAVFGLAISWRKNLTMVAWLTSLAALLCCVALMLRTQDPVPFTVSLLALAAAVEASACLEHYLGERWVVALVTNLAVLFLTYVAAKPAGALSAYQPISAGVAIALLAILPAIYLVSTMVRTFGRARSISNFEVAQCVLAFLIAGWGSIQVGQGHVQIVAAVGIFCCVASAACYLVTFMFLDRHPDKERNFQVYSAFGLGLALAGSGLLLKGVVLTGVLAALSVLFVLAGMNSGRITLKLHAAAYLVLATFASGLAEAANIRLLGAGGHAGTPPGTGIWISAAAALGCYLLLLRGKIPAPAPASYLGVSAVLAFTAFWSVAGLGAVLMSPICRRASAGQALTDYCPTALTSLLVLCCLAAAYGARRLSRRELTWVAVGLAAVAGYKLVVQDMHEATAFGVVISLMAYGATLSILPRLIRWTRTNLAGAPAR